MKKVITDEQFKFIEDHYPTMGSRYCYESLKLNPSSVSSAARRMGLKVNKEVSIKNMSKNIINIDDYINVTNKNIAYIFGLIWTDGCISFANNLSKTPIIKHSCVLYDAECLNKIFKELNWRHYVCENKQSIGKNTMNGTWLSSRELGNYLIFHNFRNKNDGTLIYKKFPNLINHFVRGLFDGDGCITMSKIGKKYMQSAIYFSSSSKQNWSYLSNILDSINVRYTIRFLSDKRGSSSQLCIHDSESIYNLCEFMYKDSDDTRLERKYNKYLDFIEYKKQFSKNNTLKKIIESKEYQLPKS